MESFGARLKREREQRKITLDDISLSTKIAPRFLIALETDQFDQLPGGIFNKGFVRSYARHLGLDETQTIADFEAASVPVLPEPEPVNAAELAAMAVRVPATRSRPEGGIPWGYFAAALLILAFGFAIWGYYSRDKSAHPRVVVPPPANSTSISEAQKTAPDIAAKPVSPEAASPTSKSPPGPTDEPSAEQPAAAAPATATESTGNAGVFLVLVKVREDSWVAITADGKAVVQDTLTAPAERSIEARNQVVIKTGNVGALDISFNGKKLAPQGGLNQVKTLTFDGNGLRP